MLDLPDDLAQLSREPSYREMMRDLRNAEWRIDNLYSIRNAEGERIRFKRNAAQLAFAAAEAPRNVIPKSRKLGFSTLIGLKIADRCIFRVGHTAGIIDRTLDDAVEKLGIIRFAFENLDPTLRSGNPLVRASDSYLEWQNGSSVSVGTSYRGGTPGDLHVSEYGKISVDTPDVAREIQTGAITAVPQTGRIWIESTAHGTGGAFADMVKVAQAKAMSGVELTGLDFKFHFFGWWIKPENKLPNHLVTVSQELRDYFAEVEAKIGRRIDADQRAWYAKEYERLGPDDIKEEAPSTADELFFVSQQGTFFREEMSRARRDKRVGFPVPYDPSRVVNTGWDIGLNRTVIWFHQTDGVRHRVIDYWEEEGASLERACGVIHQKAQERGFSYGKHYGPHDIENSEWANTPGKTRKAMAEEKGVKFTVVPRIKVKADSIEQARRLINLTWFDEEHSALGVTRLDNYRKRWNKLLGVFTPDPLEDGNEHGADAFQGLAMGLQPEKVAREDTGRSKSRGRRTSSWSA